MQKGCCYETQSAQLSVIVAFCFVLQMEQMAGG